MTVGVGYRHEKLRVEEDDLNEYGPDLGPLSNNNGQASKNKTTTSTPTLVEADQLVEWLGIRKIITYIFIVCKQRETIVQIMI